MTSVITCVTTHVHGAPHKRPIKTRLQTRLRRTNWRTFEMNAQTNLCLISPSYVSYLKLNVSSQDSHLVNLSSACKARYKCQFLIGLDSHNVHSSRGRPQLVFSSHLASHIATSFETQHTTTSHHFNHLLPPSCCRVHSPPF